MRIVFFIFLFFTIQVKCQLSVHKINQVKGVYSIPDYNGVFNTYLTFYKNGNYALELVEEITTDIQSSLVLSYGKYYTFDKYILLNDVPYGFKLKISYYDNSLICSKFLTFMIGKPLMSIENEEAVETDAFFLRIKSNQNIVIKNSKNYSKVAEGNYFTSDGYELGLGINNKFVLSFKGFHFLSGDWSQDNDIINLYDENLEFNFKIFIQSDNSLVSNCIPGNYDGLIFNKANKPLR